MPQRRPEPGLARIRVRIEKRTSRRSISGGAPYVWEFFADRWAQLTPLVGQEVFASEQRESFVPTQFTMRYLRGFDASMRIVVRLDGSDVIYNVTSISRRRGMRVWMDVTAIELEGETRAGS